MGKRISDMQRIINFGLDASAEGLQAAIEALQVIKANRYPKATTKPAREPRADKGTRRTPSAVSASGTEDGEGSNG